MLYSRRYHLCSNGTIPFHYQMYPPRSWTVEGVVRLMSLLSILIQTDFLILDYASADGCIFHLQLLTQRYCLPRSEEIRATSSSASL